MVDPKDVPVTCQLEPRRTTLRIDEVLQSDPGVIDTVVSRLRVLIEEKQCPEDWDRVELALREALANAIIHGNRSDPAKAVRVCVTMDQDCTLLIYIRDAGDGFDPTRVPNPTSRDHLLENHGRGVFLINQLMDSVRYDFDQGTSVCMRRDPPSSKRRPS